jgi:Tfp pilus assembly protein PilX
MKKNFKSRGNALILTLCLLTVASLLSSALLTVSYNAHVSTINQIDYQQAYFTARSAAAATVDYIQNHADDKSAMDNIINNQGTGSSSSMGSYTINVSYVNSDKIKILATGTYKGKTSTAAAYMVKTSVPISNQGVVPTDSLIYLNGSGVSGFGQCNVNGNIYINGDFNLSQGSKVNGQAIVTGNTSITGAGATTNGLISFGSVTIGNSGAVDGDVYTKGNLTMSGSGKINGNASSDGTLDMTSGSGYIADNATIGGDASFAGGGNKIGGILKYGGTARYAWGNSSSFVHSGAENITDYTPIDLSKYNAPSLPDVTVPSITSPAVIGSGNIVRSSGVADSNFMSAVNSLPYGSIITFDTSKDDISLIVNSNYNNGSGVCWEVSGTHNLYVYLAGNLNFSVNSNEYIGMHNRSTTPQIYIMGNGNSTVSLNNNSEMDAYIYMPHGKFSASGSPIAQYKFIGSCVCNSVDIEGNVKLNYSAPDLSGTPLEILTTQQNGSSSDKWNLEGWADK